MPAPLALVRLVRAAAAECGILLRVVFLCCVDAMQIITSCRYQCLSQVCFSTICKEIAVLSTKPIEMNELVVEKPSDAGPVDAAEK